ncbi:MAG: phage holin family protein [Nitrospirota bacterium]
MHHVKEEYSLGELLSELSQEVQRLLRQEMELAKIEMSLKTSQLMKDIAFLAIGGAVAYAGFLALVSAVILGLGTGMAWWLAALIFGIAVAGAGYFLIKRGMNDLKQRDFIPRQTVSTLKEDTQWAKEKM